MVGQNRQGHNRQQFGSIARIGTHKSARLETKSWMLARLSVVIRRSTCNFRFARHPPGKAKQQSSIPSALAPVGVLEQLCVFGFRGFEDRNLGVSIFPEIEELFVLTQSAYTRGVRDCTLRLLRFQRICASQTKMS